MLTRWEGTFRAQITATNLWQLNVFNCRTNPSPPFPHELVLWLSCIRLEFGFLTHIVYKKVSNYHYYIGGCYSVIMLMPISLVHSKLPVFMLPTSNGISLYPEYADKAHSCLQILITTYLGSPNVSGQYRYGGACRHAGSILVINTHASTVWGYITPVCTALGINIISGDIKVKV